MFETEHQKKAWIETIIVMAILVILMFITGLKYMDPPPPGNIAINFGTDDEGSGKMPVKEKTEYPVQPTPPPPPQPEPVKEEPVLTTQEEAPVVQEPVREEQPVQEETPPPPQPSQETREVLDNIFNAPSGNENAASEGDDAQAGGDKGSPEGDEQAPGYYGTGGTGGNDPNYILGNRRAISKPRPSYNCDEEGKVVVRITVNPEGKVIHAEIDRGTTAGSCLTQAALEAARATVWEKDPNAEPKQIGKIIYFFKLKE